ncbi:hypothetical protein R2F61_08215 [Mollicutes bacterium LVI A0078]|nr:hypothetical protein RZE84_07990 [Mollicutes bacterium LVI A0075]WOO90697.1 hypothetical protein R2F61_08215 [Mollicutes bacterium LVI A0078]
MDQIEKAVIYIGSYFMLFVAAIALQIMSDLPSFYDVLVFFACVYIIWARDEILAYHVIGFHVKSNGSKFKKVLSSLLRIILGLVIIKLMIMGLFQYVLILYLIDYLTWIQTGRAISQVVSLCTIERNVNESKA